MFFLKLLLTGIITGLLGYLVLEKMLKRYFLNLSMKKQILAVVILGFLYAFAFASIFAGLIADLTQTDVFVVWLFILPGIFSANTLIIVIVVFSVVVAGGYNEFASIANEVLAPFVAGTIGFFFGLLKPRESYSLYYDPGVVATVNFMAGMIGGIVSAAIAFITKKILTGLFPGDN